MFVHLQLQLSPRGTPSPSSHPRYRGIPASGRVRDEVEASKDNVSIGGHAHYWSAVGVSDRGWVKCLILLTVSPISSSNW